ncbi:TauD/TfdA family dioxygenase [Kibdelosporangium lantanae]
MRPIQTDHRPLLVQAVDGEPTRWPSAFREALRSMVTRHGAVVVRGLDPRGADDLRKVCRGLGAELMVGREGFAPRTDHGGLVYSSSRWPADQPMCMHHELSYRLEVPGLLVLACLDAPTTGGATPLADATAVLDQLPADLVDRFTRQGWLLRRSYQEDVGVSLDEAFGTGDRRRVEEYCRSNDIEFEWRTDGSLRTSQRRPAVVAHPVTGQRCWFNQIAFLNEWTMAPEVREYLVEVHGPDRLPFTTCYGDGTPVGPDMVELINSVYDANTVRTPWETGDLMLVDNIRTAHATEPYTGSREVLVGLADPVKPAGLVPGI